MNEKDQTTNLVLKNCKWSFIALVINVKRIALKEGKLKEKEQIVKFKVKMNNFFT
jgi:hypothetical protein